jgi:hypothetical protein
MAIGVALAAVAASMIDVAAVPQDAHVCLPEPSVTQYT